MDFGGDPDTQYNRDRSVLADIERDLGASYFADRVGRTHGGPTPGFGTDNINAVDEAAVKQTEHLQSQISDNQPLKRASRKRKREQSMDFGGDPDSAASDLPNAKRAKIEPVLDLSGLTSPSTAAIAPVAVAPAEIDVIAPESGEPPEPERAHQTELDELEPYLHGRPSMNDTSLMITHDADGEQLYVHYDSRLSYQREMKRCLRLNARGRAAMSVLSDGQTIDALMDEVQAERIASQLNADIDVMNEDFTELVREQKDDNCKVDTQLWVDKYAPRGIMSLLSSEKINREVTAWVKQWDMLVFGHKYIRAQHDGNNKFVKNRARKTQKAKAAKNAERVSSRQPKLRYSVMNNLPAMGMGMGRAQMKCAPKVRKEKRPEVSVLLFAGPPGTGKSTLAHIVANHCGYRPFEINASDDRSGKKLREVIVSAATTRPMFGDTRPPLIIMDEIDGALNSNGDAKSAVDVILKLVKEAKDHHAKAAKQRKNSHGKKDTTKGSKKIVNRPIICICNDEYAKSLRPLREICTVFRFKPIATRTLCKRLLDICRREFIHTDLRTLSYLASITNNDVRASLHTLQFFKENSGNGSRLSSRLTADQLQSTPIGRKDKTQSIFDVWTKILKTRDADKEKAEGTNREKIGMKAQWAEIAAMMYGQGNNDKVLDGVVENYPLLGFSDPMFAICNATAQWIEAFDVVKQCVRAKQQWSLGAYLPLLMAGVHESCATDTFQRLAYPKASYAASVALKENRTVLRRFLTAEAEAGSKVRKVAADTEDAPIIDTTQFASLLGRFFGAEACALSLVPMLPFLVLTNERWNNSDFASDAEKKNRRDFGDAMSRDRKSNKKLFVGIIGTMIECGLTFAKRDRNSVELFLRPPIDRLSRFTFTDPTLKQRAALPRMRDYVKQKVAHQIVLEVLRRNEAGAHKYHKYLKDGAKGEESEEGESGDEATQGMTPFMSAKGKKRASRTKNMLQTPCGGGQFGRFVPKNMLTQQQPNVQATKDKNFLVAFNKSKSGIQKYEFPILYRFVEGYTNAVRRKSFVKDWI